VVTSSQGDVYPEEQYSPEEQPIEETYPAEETFPPVPQYVPSIFTASTSYTDNDGLVHIRVYTQNNGYIYERINDGEGFYFATFQAFDPAVSATSWFTDGEHIRVYVSNDVGTFENAWDGVEMQWQSTYFYYPGLHTSVVSWVDANGSEHIRLYMSMRDGSIVECAYDDEAWTFNTQIDLFSSPFGYIRTTASTAWLDQDGQVHIRVYVHENGYIWEGCYDGSEWYQGEFRAYGSQISVTSWWQENSVFMRAYVIDFDNQVHEKMYDAGWNDSWVEYDEVAVSTSTVSWLDSIGAHTRTYVTDEQGQLFTHSYDAAVGWDVEPFN